ncbi:hypothetical protein ABZ322_11820 [Streptomyces sp. NPDC006129]|uniref:hypothetical protein n=1 Tax=unclassified Streptomyces TaxID=2593676 RepID=UPI0033B25756
MHGILGGNLSFRDDEQCKSLYAVRRVEGPKGLAEDAANDTLIFVPVRKLPPWFKGRWVHATVRNKVELTAMAKGLGKKGLRREPKTPRPAPSPVRDGA